MPNARWCVDQITGHDGTRRLVPHFHSEYPLGNDGNVLVGELMRMPRQHIARLKYEGVPEDPAAVSHGSNTKCHVSRYDLGEALRLG